MRVVGRGSYSSTRLFATTNRERIDLLHNFLSSRHEIDPQELTDANCEEVGESALRTYKTYVSPSVAKLETFLSHPPHMVTQAAERTSSQIAHLVNRHRAARSETLRNSDDANKPMLAKNPLIMVLVDVRSSPNVGQLMRTADAVACEKFVCVGITPTPDGLGGSKVKKVSLGSEKFVDVVRCETWADALVEIEGYWKVGLETVNGAVELWDAKFGGETGGEKGTAIILGNEVTGITARVLEDVDEIVEIPMMGGKNSLNVAAAGAVVSYEVLRRHQRK